ncbi:hypothetical protein OY671_005007 [Metschnikowia pulcherrima]|nr:hypothetical protein OY671_005007 [Metschnikowia pulcherrima]
MGQKRTKNQIRREREKLRKLEKLEGATSGKNETNIPEKDPVTETPEKASQSAKATATEARENAKPNGNIGEERKREDSEGQKQIPVIGDEKNVDSSPVSSGLTAISKESDEKIPDSSSQSVIIGDFTTDAGGESKSAIENEALAKPDFRKTEEGKPDEMQADTETLPEKQASEPKASNTSTPNPNPDPDPKTKHDVSDDEPESNKEQIMGIFSRLKDTPKESSLQETDLYTQYAGIFHKFEPKPETKTQVVLYTTSDASASSSDIDSDHDSSTRPLSKRQRRIREKIPISVLKSATSKPQAVEWYDADAPDPYMAVFMKTALNHVNVPSHWQQKKEYLSSKRGLERAPFQLPKYIANTGIAEMRNHDADSLKKSQRDRVQPKMGRLDIDYQRLHDAFFKHQTKPRVLAFGEVYSEGRETSDQHLNEVARMRPGRISKALRAAVGMSENETVAPPWITVMHELGKPPSYSHLIIPGLDVEYTNSGYKVQYGEKGSVLGSSRETWGMLEDGEESDAESDSGSEVSSVHETNEPEIGENPGSENFSKTLYSEEPDDNQPERVEITEFAKVKKPSASAIPKSSGSLYTVLKETPADSSSGTANGKHRYDLKRGEESESEAKRLKSVKKSPVVENDEDFRF